MKIEKLDNFQPFGPRGPKPMLATKVEIASPKEAWLAMIAHLTQLEESPEFSGHVVLLIGDRAYELFETSAVVLSLMLDQACAHSKIQLTATQEAIMLPLYEMLVATRDSGQTDPFVLDITTEVIRAVRQLDYFYVNLIAPLGLELSKFAKFDTTTNTQPPSTSLDS